MLDKSIETNGPGETSPNDTPGSPALSVEESLPRRVVVKFWDDLDLPYEDRVEGYISEIGPWQDIADNFPGLTVNRVFTSLSPEQLVSLARLGEERDPTYKAPNFLTFFVVIVPAEFDPFLLARILSEWDIIEYAYVESLPAPSPAVPAGANPEMAGQLYLGPPQVGTAGALHMGGINEQGIWANANSSGEGITFIDIEKGWQLTHEDLLDPVTGAPLITLLDGVNNDEIAHGTCVLGILAAQDNAVGCVGIAQKSTGHVVSPWQPPALLPTDWNISNAIIFATNSLAVPGVIGDVMLLEVQVLRTEPRSAVDPTLVDRLLPAEAERANWEAIRLATAVGIVVVEAAGNGEKAAAAAPGTPTTGIFLDNITDDQGEQIFSPGHLEERDSGAIMVAAAEPFGNQAQRTAFSNYGARVDCYAWGNTVRAPSAPAAVGETIYDADGDGYTATFDGTSSAAAIVAGAAIVMQGLAQHHVGFRYEPFSLRQVIKATGTSPVDIAQGIGVMPNLRAFFDNGLGVVPDVFVRDHVGDDGDPHAGSIANSPDIIVRPAAGPESVGDGVAAFGPASGTMNSVPVGSTVTAGSDHKVYVRARNRGGSNAAAVGATVYYSPPSSLISPVDWQVVGSTAAGTDVPVGVGTITVLAPIDWLAANLPPVNPDPAMNHYCFIAVIGNVDDPTPIPDHAVLPGLTWDQFFQLIRNNNNVTWRNFNVVPMPLAGGGIMPLPFWVRGAWDEARPLQLEVVARLPRPFRLRLGGNDDLLEKIPARVNLREDDEGNVGIQLNPHGVTRFRPVRLPVKYKALARLLVEVPDGHWPGPFEVYARQLYRGEEVGRISWRLVPTRASG